MMTDIYDISVVDIDGNEMTLEPFCDKVLLIVNVASKCGLTPQYEGLESLYEQTRDLGFEILAFPANDFAGQEPGSDAEIKAFCTSKYNVSFPMFSKIVVTGENKHPLYKFLIEEAPTAVNRAEMEENLRGYNIEPTPEPEVVWNFEKFVVSRSGQVLGRFAPNTPLDDVNLVNTIRVALANG
ncbi:Glutathione peroxidase, house-cleaning role in reducing lipid peroxides [Marinomonas fungiae]|uniref:Glutathione peroxidase n=2 Tax=Marinomonas fungiae TaxID=1137284 RepID=A0A0K6IH69_9GAMM|nr:Glutathione peroxidase, house-cleaning role in reducing lipid peroxides [Marinomonas fungiae]